MPMPQCLFAYGTLQFESVQMATFGRRLAGSRDALAGFVLVPLTIDDPAVVAVSGKAQHTMARFTGRQSDVIPGTVFSISEHEIQSADRYEVAAVKRVAVVLQSGVPAWAYVDARHESAPVEIRPAREADAASLSEAVKAVAAEKWYLATIDGFSLEQTRAYLQRIRDDLLPQVTALVGGEVVGFCDIIPDTAQGFAHVARLGMGVRFEWRRQGIGRRMLDACLSLARHSGIEKVELEVFSDNLGAVRLYESFGFSLEGVKVRGRKLEGRYQDVKLMALWL
jgi:RimJ/RimL family protein N-acetyltransferase